MLGFERTSASFRVLEAQFNGYRCENAVLWTWVDADGGAIGYEKSEAKM